MNQETDLTNWFPDIMTDETACAIHQFLTEFTRHFEGRYYGQIRRDVQFLKDDVRKQKADSGTPLVDG